MRNASPLRYPGGKAAMAGLLADIRRSNGLSGRAFAEPFAGGAGAALTMLYMEEASEIFINDADPAIYSFWWTLVHRPSPFIELLRNCTVSLSEWEKQRRIYRSSSTSRLRRGFATFYLNRCNHSGIVMNGGPIGGIAQEGNWKLDARFNRVELVRRCERISEYGSRIRVSDNDGIGFLDRLDPKSVFFFIDPPYYVKGKTLYLNLLDEKYHETLAMRLSTMKDAAWVLTYDDCKELRSLYQGWANIRPFTLNYSARQRRRGNEILITPRWMSLPSHQYSTAISW